MQETLRLLKGLQELDRNLYQVRDEIKRLPGEQGRRAAQIGREKDRLAEMEAHIHQLRSRIKEIEDLTTIQRQRIRKLENQASESRADVALHVAFQHEIKSLKKEISEAEEEGLGIVEETERLQGERDKFAAEIEEAEKNFSEYSGNVERELGEAESKRKELDEERRRRIGSEVAPDVLERYEKLLDAREGQAMAELDGRICQGCFVNVPNNVYVKLARGMDLVTCPSCNRILYLPE